VPDLLFWVYLANAVTLIVHEVDSAYWKEWELFRLPGGLTGFLLLHFPLVALILVGLVHVAQGLHSGLIVSMVLSLGGLFAFSIHRYFISRGRDEFKTPVSQAILLATLLLSLMQGALTLQTLL
jgi:uncharacterized membrane-anchored protein